MAQWLDSMKTTTTTTTVLVTCKLHRLLLYFFRISSTQDFDKTNSIGWK